MKSFDRIWSHAFGSERRNLSCVDDSIRRLLRFESLSERTLFALDVSNFDNTLPADQSDWNEQVPESTLDETMDSDTNSKPNLDVIPELDSHSDSDEPAETDPSTFPNSDPSSSDDGSQAQPSDPSVPPLNPLTKLVTFVDVNGSTELNVSSGDQIIVALPSEWLRDSSKTLGREVIVDTIAPADSFSVDEMVDKTRIPNSEGRIEWMLLQSFETGTWNLSIVAASDDNLESAITSPDQQWIVQYEESAPDTSRAELLDSADADPNSNSLDTSTAAANPNQSTLIPNGNAFAYALPSKADYVIRLTRASNENNATLLDSMALRIVRTVAIFGTENVAVTQAWNAVAVLVGGGAPNPNPPDGGGSGGVIVGSGGLGSGGIFNGSTPGDPSTDVPPLGPDPLPNPQPSENTSHPGNEKTPTDVSSRPNTNPDTSLVNKSVNLASTQAIPLPSVKTIDLVLSTTSFRTVPAHPSGSHSETNSSDPSVATSSRPSTENKHIEFQASVKRLANISGVAARKQSTPVVATLLHAMPMLLSSDMVKSLNKSLSTSQHVNYKQTSLPNDRIKQEAITEPTNTESSEVIRATELRSNRTDGTTSPAGAVIPASVQKALNETSAWDPQRNPEAKLASIDSLGAAANSISQAEKPRSNASLTWSISVLAGAAVVGWRHISSDLKKSKSPLHSVTKHASFVLYS